MSGYTNLNIIHGDLDAFFASVEQRENPSLQGQPVIVGGHPDTRGVVSTCSYEARRYGVKSAMPLSMARRMCPQAVFLPVNMKLYKQVSSHIMRIMAEYTPLIEPISIDEAFLDVGGSKRLFGTAECVALRIKQRVWQEQGLHISMGISCNKFLAKLATELGKPDGLKVISEGDIPDILTPLPVGYLWGVGEKTLAELNRRGIKTIGDLRQVSTIALESLLGSVAPRLLQLADGIDNRKVEATTEPGSLGKEITFTEDIDDYTYLLNQLLDFTDQLTKRLRQRNLIARTMVVKIRYSDFRTITRSQTLAEATDSERVIYGQVEQLMNKIDTRGKKVRLIGLSLSNLSRPDLRQETLFDEKQREERKLDQALDKLKERFGDDVIVRAIRLTANKPDME